MKKIVFTIAALAFSLGHILVFFAWQKQLSLNETQTFNLAIIIIILAITSSLSSFFIYWRDNLVNRFIYLLSAIWSAILLNSLLLYIFFAIFAVFIDNTLLVFLYFILQIPLLLYEFYLAYFIKVRRFDAEIQDLNDFWHNKKILHISDIHLGPIWRSKHYKRIVKKINSLKPDAVFISGDFFDGVELDFSWLKISDYKIEAKYGIYYSLGNHDEDLGISRVKNLLKKTNFEILDDKMLVNNGLQIIGLISGHGQKIDVENKILEQINYDKKKPSILLFHEPKYMPEASKAGIDLQLSGHTHGGQLFPFNIITSWLYKGNNFGVYRKNGLILSVSSGIGTWGPPFRLGSQSEIVEIKLIKKK